MSYTLCLPLHPQLLHQPQHEQHTCTSPGELGRLFNKSRSTNGRGRCWKLFPVWGGDGTKISPTGNIFDQPLCERSLILCDDKFRRQILFWVQTTVLLGNAVSLDSHAPVSFPTPAHWRGRHRADSVTRFDLPRTSTLRYLEYSASRQSSLPINRDRQQTATNYLLYQSRACTKHHFFFAFHKLLERYMKAQQLVQLHGTSCVV